MIDKDKAVDAAECILLAFAKDASAGQEVSYILVEDYFVRHNCSLKNTTIGLRYAQQMGWIKVKSFRSIILLEPGLLYLTELRAIGAERGRNDYIGLRAGTETKIARALQSQL